MNEYYTKYGLLKHVGEHVLYANGSIKDCVMLDKVELVTAYGTLIPQYEYTDHRRKHIYSASFYETGELRRIALNYKMDIMTPIGSMSAELITFYESGRLKRLFPLNGQISAYWDENDEYLLAKEKSFEFPFGKFTTKIIAISFYENGAIKNLTLWPQEKIKIRSPIGEMRVRIGISLYPEGSIKSVEPAYPKVVQTPIGAIKAFDFNANGITGDRNSLTFSTGGTVHSLITSEIKVTVQGVGMDNPITFTPEQEEDEDGIEVCFRTLKMEFGDNSVSFNGGEKYDLPTNQFKLEPYRRSVPSLCGDCASCGGCS
ncbi:MAG: repeat protein [Herbinix sp.]|jgi:antitoxin component YwqK of YwqJK toxin-antitoxin module|nr:repeat protein [Herbinix sp.]